MWSLPSQEEVLSSESRSALSLPQPLFSLGSPVVSARPHLASLGGLHYRDNIPAGEDPAGEDHLGLCFLLKRSGQRKHGPPVAPA